MIKLKQKEYIAPWEKAFDSVLSPLEEFIHRQYFTNVMRNSRALHC